MKGKKRILKKHASTIHCTNNMSLLSRKISNILLYHAYSELQTKEEHEISISHLAKLLNANTNNHEALKDALRQLVSTVIEWNILNHKTGNEDWTATTILSSVNWTGGICKYSYSPRMKALIYEPTIYGKINLLIQTRFKSNYGLALYENCSRYRSIRQTKDFTIDEFRKLMGVKDSQYKVFRDFKKRVLDKAVDEVNTASDLFVEYTLSRVGRKVSNVKFNIREKEIKPRFIEKNNIEVMNEDVSTELISFFGLTQKAVKDIISTYSKDYVLEKISLIKHSQSFKEGKIKDMGSYLISALKNDFKETKSSADVLDKQAQKLKDANIEHEKQMQIEEENRREYQKYKKQLFFDTFNSLEDAVKLNFIDNWLNDLKNQNNFNSKRIKRLFKEKRFAHAQVAASFMTFVKNHKPEFIINLVSYEEYIVQRKMLEIS